MERLQKWEYSESSSSIVARAPSGQLLPVIVSLEGKSLSAGHKHSAALIAAASTSVGLHVYVYNVLQLASNLVVMWLY